MTEERTTPDRSRLEINYVQVVASALAAISSAVLLSTVGVAGTIIGAAIGSVFATAGSAIYSYSIRASRERVARAQAAAFARMQAARAGIVTRPMSRSAADPANGPDAADAAMPPVEKEPPAWREAIQRLPWKWVAVIAVGVFVAAMIVILCFELIAGRSVSTLTGGTGDGGHRTSFGFGKSSTATESPTPTPTPTPSSSPTQPTISVPPTVRATPSPTPTPTATTTATTAPPSLRATPTPTPTPSPSATVGSTPTSSATPSGTPSP